MGSKVVCVSRTLAASGDGIGRALADRLGFKVVDAEVIQRAAEKAGVDARQVEEVERRRPLFNRLFAPLRVRGLPADGGYQREATWSEAAAAAGSGTEARLRTLIRESIEEIAAEGRVVLIAHAASLALSGREDVLKVLVTASVETRVRRLVQLSGATIAEARSAVSASDLARAEYLRRFYGVDQEQPTHYDLVVNTDLLTAEQAVELIHAAAR
jgi:cytidylate kinase